MILGAPNVGKSTLLNRLAGREAAITSDIAGTTRDVVEVRMDLRGLPVSLLDTAGLRETLDQIEALGIERAHMRADQADLRIVLTTDGTVPLGYVSRETDLIVWTKADVTAGAGLAISARTGQGIDQLIDVIADRLTSLGDGGSVLIRERHRVAVENAIDALIVAEGWLDRPEVQAEIVAQHLYTAIRALDSLVGRVDVEDILDEIFSSFCLGK